MSEEEYDKNGQQVWDDFTMRQKDHFLKDHKSEFSKIKNWLEIISLDFSDLPNDVQKSIIKHVAQGKYKFGATVKPKESEWLVVLEGKDGFEIDETVFAKTEDEAYHKAELLHKGSKAMGINMLTDASGKKIEYAKGSTITTNEWVIESFLSDKKELKVGNLSTHYSTMGDVVLLRNYGTLIAKRKGKTVSISTEKYSKTTTIIQNMIERIANRMGLKVEKIAEDEFAKGGSMYAEGGGIEKEYVVSGSVETNQYHQGLSKIVSAENEEEAIDIATYEAEEEYSKEWEVVPSELEFNLKARERGKYAKGGGIGNVVLYRPEDLKDFWSNPKNSNKTIYFVEEMEEEDGEPYYVVGNQTKKYYDDSQYWDYDYNFDDVDEAVKQAKLEVKKNKGIYAENLRVIRGYAKGSTVKTIRALKSFNSYTDSWFDAVADKSSELKSDKRLKELIDLTNRPATRKNLEAFKKDVQSVPYSRNTRNAIDMHIQAILNNKFNSEFKNQFGGIRDSVQKNSATSNFFDSFNQASSYEFKYGGKAKKMNTGGLLENDSIIVHNFGMMKAPKQGTFVRMDGKEAIVIVNKKEHRVSQHDVSKFSFECGGNMKKYNDGGNLDYWDQYTMDENDSAGMRYAVSKDSAKDKKEVDRVIDEAISEWNLMSEDHIEDDDALREKAVPTVRKEAHEYFNAKGYIDSQVVSAMISQIAADSDFSNESSERSDYDHFENIKSGLGWVTVNYVNQLPLTINKKRDLMKRLAEEEMLFDEDVISEDELDDEDEKPQSGMIRPNNVDDYLDDEDDFSKISTDVLMKMGREFQDSSVKSKTMRKKIMRELMNRTDDIQVQPYEESVKGHMNFRKGGVAGSKHVSVTKGNRLPHGYKAVKGLDRNKRYSRGYAKVNVDKGWRLPKGYEVEEGAYNMKYRTGGEIEDDYFKSGEMLKETYSAIENMRKNVNQWSIRDTLLKFTEFGFYKGNVMASIDEQTALDILKQLKVYVNEIRDNERNLDEVYSLIHSYSYMNKKFKQGGGMDAILQVGDMVKIMPNYSSHYANEKGEVVKEMPDGKTYEIKIKHKRGNEYVKFDKSDLIFMGNQNRYSNGGGIEDCGCEEATWMSKMSNEEKGFAEVLCTKVIKKEPKDCSVDEFRAKAFTMMSALTDFGKQIAKSAIQKTK
jgi:hypothetical protein